MEPILCEASVTGAAAILRWLTYEILRREIYRAELLQSHLFLTKVSVYFTHKLKCFMYLRIFALGISMIDSLIYRGRFYSAIVI